MSLVVKRTAAAGGTDAQLTDQSSVYLTLTGMFTSAGWTALDVLSATDIVFKSVGETTFETLYIRIRGTIADAIQFIGYQFWDPIGHNGYNEMGNIDTSGNFYSGTGARGYMDWNQLPSGLYDYIFCVDRDGFVAFIKHNGSGNYWFQNGGNFQRVPGARKSTMNLQTGVTAGSYVTCTMDVDPVVAGYKRGDLIKFVSQQITGPATGVIPLFTTRVVDLNSGAKTITVETVFENVSAGCLVGADPMPFYLMYTNGFSADPYTQDGCRALTISYGGGIVNEFQNRINIYTRTGYGDQTTAYVIGDLSGNRPNKRTNRYGIFRLTAIDAHYYYTTNGLQTGSVFRGYLNKLFSFAQPVTLYDIARTPKDSPSHDYVCINWSGDWFCIGPVV